MPNRAGAGGDRARQPIRRWDVPESLSGAEVRAADGTRILLRRHGNVDGPRLVLNPSRPTKIDLIDHFPNEVHKMRRRVIWKDWVSFVRARVVWSLMAGLMLTGSSVPLLACDDGVAVPDPEHNPGLVADCKALLAARDKLAGNGRLNWNAGSVIDAWQGITVSGSPRRVTELSISPLHISGEIPAELGQLSDLAVIFLPGNYLTGHFLTGEIPPELGNLSRLEILYLNDNRLTGPIPPELGQLSQVYILNLGNNQLTGPIPPELGRLSRLEELHLWTNQLSGEIPRELGQLVQLRQLTLAANHLTGMIPLELVQLSQLGWLDIGSNRLTGAIPPGLGQLSRLGRLSLRNNQLTGVIPAELGQLSLLGWFYVSDNQLSGEIPAELGQLPRLRELDLSNNQLQGNIPPSLGELTNLEELSLAGNRLTGEIPVEITRLSPLKDLQLSNNRLRGKIPPALGQLTNLVELNLSNNQLSGEIPAELGQLSVLKNLLLSANRFTGRIPKELGKLSQLSGLYLDNNQLTGMIPPELSQLSLAILHLQHNQLTGPIPAELGQYRTLREFSYRGNELTGPVPPHLTHLPDVYVLNLTATRTAPDRIEVTWDDPGDTTVSYEFRLLVEEARTWTAWAQIEKPETTLRRGEGPTIEWTLIVPPPHIVYRAIQIRVSNARGSYSSNSAWVRHLAPVASGDADPMEGIFVPVLLTSAGRNNAFFTSELTLTNRGSEEATLHYTYTAHAGGGSGTATDTVAPGQQKIQRDAIGYLTGLGIPIPGSGNRIGTLRVEVSGSSQVSVTTRTTTAVPDGRAGLAYPAIAEDQGFQEAVYLCGLRQNTQDRSNVAFQHMGSPDEGSITLRTSVYSGEPDDTSPQVVGEVELQPGGFHQYSGLLARLGRPAQGYVKVEKVAGDAPFYAYGVINDNFNSDGSFVFPLTASSLVGTTGQTLPVIIETGNFQSELTVTNFSATDKQVDFSFVAEAVDRGNDTATFSLTLKAGEQTILPDIVEELRRREVEGIGGADRAYVGALFATPAEGDMSGIVIGARTGSPDGRGGQYSLFYNGVPYGGASVESAWIYGLQQNAENRSNLALVNTGEIDDSSSTFEITIYDGSGEVEPRRRSVTLGPRRWTQENGILGRISQGYVQVRKVSGNNPFITYGVVNDGGRPGERSGDGAFLPARE